MKKSKFRDLTFENIADFNKWLDENTYKKIQLKDFYKDEMTIWVHKSGEILHSDCHTRVYIGKFISMRNLDGHLKIWDDESGQYINYGTLHIESIITYSPKKLSEVNYSKDEIRMKFEKLSKDKKIETLNHALDCMEIYGDSLDKFDCIAKAMGYKHITKHGLYVKE